VLTQPKTQFYGLRDYMVEDPDGYQLSFYTPVVAENCPQDPAAATANA
jgi:hypothetical protein